MSLLLLFGIFRMLKVQSQWVGTHTFAFKAEVDFDGTFLAAKLKLNTRSVPTLASAGKRTPRKAVPALSLPR